MKGHEDNSPSAIIYGVARGELPCEDLFPLGIKIERVDGHWTVYSPNLEGAKLHISDIAYGLLKYQSRPDDLKKWARLILMGSGFIDLSECEHHSVWDELLNALWEAMEKGKITTRTRLLVEGLS